MDGFLWDAPNGTAQRRDGLPLETNPLRNACGRPMHAATPAGSGGLIGETGERATHHKVKMFVRSRGRGCPGRGGDLQGLPREISIRAILGRGGVYSPRRAPHSRSADFVEPEVDLAKAANDSRSHVLQGAYPSGQIALDQIALAVEIKPLRAILGDLCL